MEKNPWFRALLVLSVLALALYLGGKVWEVLQHYADIIIVFFLAWLLAFILSPFAQSLERRRRIPRALAVSLVYLLLFLNVGIVFVLIVPLAADQFVQFGQKLPLYLTEVQDWGLGWATFVQYELGSRGVAVDITSVNQSLDLSGQVGKLGTGLVTNTISVVGGVASVLTNVVIVLVLSFYLVLDGEVILKRIDDLMPEKYRLEGQFFFESINRTFGGWLRGSLLVSLIYGVGNAIVMAGAGLSYVVLASLFAAVLMIIPLFGPVLAMVAPILLAATMGDATRLIFVIVGLLVLQILVFNVLSPKLMGDSVGMHPLLVFLALLFGLKQAGVVGAIFGVPVVGVVYAMLMYFVQKGRQKGRADSPTGESPDAGSGRDVAPPPRRAWAAGAGALVWQFLGPGTVRAVTRLRQLFGRTGASYGARARSGD